MKNKQLIFGRQPLVEALKEQKRIDKILIYKDARGEVIDEIKAMAKEQQVFVQLVMEDVLEKTLFRNGARSQPNHQGVLAFLSLIDYYKIEDVLPQIYEKGEVPLILVLENITDVGNFGAIARSALCLGAHALVIPHAHFAQINHDAMKSSAGALTQVTVCREFSLRRAVEYLKYNGVQIYATHVDKGMDIASVDLKEPCAIILGAEDTGVSHELLEKCDARVIIPMSGGFDSLNVSVSTGIVLYEALRQRLPNKNR